MRMTHSARPPKFTLARRLAVGGVVAVSALVVAGCGDVSDDGILTMGGDSGEVCMPAAAGDVVAVGDVARLQELDSRVVVEDVYLDSPDGIRQVGAWIVPLADGVSIGAISLDDPPANWDDREDAVGGVIEGEPYVNFVVELERAPDSERATASAIVVEYRDADGALFTAKSTTRIVLRDSCV